jgi:hypothetical protein
MRFASSLVARHWRGAIALGLITTLAAFFRFWQLDAIPPGFHYDEAYEALEAWRVMTQPGYHPIFFPGNFGVEPMFIYLTSLAFRLFGATHACAGPAEQLPLPDRVGRHALALEAASLRGVDAGWRGDVGAYYPR